MARWQCKLRVSCQARWLSLLLHGTAILALLFSPWPVRDTPLGMLLLMLVILEAMHSQRRICNRQGDVALLVDGQFRWCNRRWHLRCRPWFSQQALLLSLLGMDGKRQHLWLFADSMEQKEWRLLRQQLLMNLSAADATADRVNR